MKIQVTNVTRVIPRPGRSRDEPSTWKRINDSIENSKCISDRSTNEGSDENYSQDKNRKASSRDINNEIIR